MELWMTTLLDWSGASAEDVVTECRCWHHAPVAAAAAAPALGCARRFFRGWVLHTEVLPMLLVLFVLLVLVRCARVVGVARLRLGLCLVGNLRGL